jgi:predicted metal-dependent phosphoesterase TrpH
LPIVPAAATIHPHLAAPRRPGHVRVDFHLHTMWSGDATTTPDELEEAVRAAELDVLCITDHGTVNGALELARADRLPCRVIVGQELRTWAGEVIGLFLSERLPYGLKPEETVARIRAQGGLVYIPHPFDPTRHCLRAGVLDELVGARQVDAVEVFNAKTSLAHLNEQARAYAARHDLAGGAGSDAHEPSAVGAAYLEMPDFDGPADFADAMRRGVVVGHSYDRARQWRPRIVPSTRSI